MSSLANPALPSQGPILMQPPGISSSLDGVDGNVDQRILKRRADSESESDSDTSSEEEESSDDDKHVAENPILKERLKQLDRYATRIHHTTHSPNPVVDPITIPALYNTNLPVAECTNNNGSLSAHGKSSGPSELADSSSTPSEYRSHQLSVAESPNPCSGPASLNTSVTPKHNFSPPYGILTSAANSGPASQSDQLGNIPAYQKYSGNFSCKPAEQSMGYSLPSQIDNPSLHRIPGGDYTEEDNQEFVCDVCNAVYSNRSSLRSHMKKHINHVTKRHQCDQCPYSTQYGKNLFKHMESMHMTDKEGQYHCGECSRRFPNEMSLRDHECTMSQCSSYRCPECGRVFKTKLRLKYHADIHNPRKPYVCDVEGCDRAFRTPKYLKNHRDEFHRMQPKNYLCPVEGCDLIFHRKTHLKRHIATHDESEKKYHCQWPNCQRRFCSEETLNLHYRKHTGEKPFNCALCPFSCYNKPSLNEHYRLQHAKDANVEGPYKTFSPQFSSPQRLSVSSFGMGAHVEGNNAIQGRTSTPVPVVRHRMADILESCGPQPPGPLDAEINGILDSLDKESDLPDLFNSGTFDFEHSNQEAPPFRNHNHPSATSHLSPTHERGVGHSSGGHDFLLHNRTEAVNGPTSSGDPSLTTILTTVLTELQQAEASGSVEEFERAKTNAVNSLPTFSTGTRLGEQIDSIMDDILDAIMNQPFQVTRSMFFSSKSFTRDESHMIESLEQQLLADTPLIAPTPPRRRGRRPKLQQQLQPFLERIFSLESSTAEAMSAHLVNVAQQERNATFYSSFYQPVGFPRSRGRGRGCRPRGGTGRPLSLTLRLLSDDTASRAGQGVYRAQGMGVRGALVNRRIRGGIRGRYRIERPSSSLAHSFPPTSDDSTGLPGVNMASHLSPSTISRQNETRQITSAHGSNLRSTNLYAENCSSPHDEMHDASMQLRAIRKSADSDEELDELEEADECDEDVSNVGYNLPETKTNSESHIRQANVDVCSEMNRNKMSNSSSYQREKESVNQDALGEMLEDLGVIVKRIGERAAARNQPHAQDSPMYNQPLNLAEYAGGDRQSDCSVASLLLGATKTTRTRTDNHVPSVQLPSMAALASGSVGTPASTGGSTPGCPPNADFHSHSPRLSSSSHPQHPSSVPGSRLSNQSNTPLSDLNASNIESTTPGPQNQSVSPNDYKTQPAEYQRSAPMWSCESMCCPTTRENCLISPEQVDPNGTYSPMAPGSVSAGTHMYNKEENADTTQSYHPTDLSTRMLSYDPDQRSPMSPKLHPNLADTERATLQTKPGVFQPYPVHFSSDSTAMGSLMSAVEAVDHLRSLSALGAKYTASLSRNEDEKSGQSYSQFRLPGYQYTGQRQQPNVASPPPPSHRMDSTSPAAAHGQPQHYLTDMFTSSHMPSALNNLLCRDRKGDGSTPASLGPVGSAAQSSSPTRLEFPPHTNPGSAGTMTGAYSPYHPSSISSRCSSRGRNELCGGTGPATGASYPLATTSTASACSSTSSSSSSSARSYLQELYQQQQQQQLQREQHYQHHHQQQQQQQRSVKSPVNNLTTRQLLSEAAATAYAHGLGRCDGQNFGGSGLSVPGVHQMNHANNSPRHSSYSHHTGNAFSPTQYNRYHASETNSYTHPNAHSEVTEHGFHAGDFGTNGFPYMGQQDPYSLYQQQLRQSSHAHHMLSRSMEHSQPQTATQLAHSIHEVSGLAAAEAAAAAAYAYHQYHQQQQAHRHGLAAHASNAHSHYQNLLSPTSRGYYPGQLDEHLSPRDLALYSAQASERRDPKSAYLAESYRSSHGAASGRFLF
ncbi:hypothetical protein T265_02159 [Opisthorchis viverrini]|uniref:C2H2-type domain-containing protein n=1 Tax=Opisthorchis viverrini TaxID=6198 RepID=A0A074ZW59_OPIVI|nr:hypothetical protein T265_02159 [Opisthorchis viverrini]KER31653.1 hypothetical protein T265_02159 [Opisthorchis viverrini]